MEEIEFNEWQKIDLRTAKIIGVDDVAGKDKLYQLQIELGEEKGQLVAGIKPFYSKEELIGKTIIVVANLKPARIAGIESQGMLLAVKRADNSYCLLTTDRETLSGTKVE